MKKLLLKLGIAIAIIISLSLTACNPVLYDAEPNSAVMYYSAPGYYNGNYYRNIRHRAPRNFNVQRGQHNEGDNHKR
jgi:hypothetical protein